MLLLFMLQLFILVNQQLLISFLYYNFKSIFSLPYNFYFLLLLIELCFSPVFVSLSLFRTHKWRRNISNRHHIHFNIGLAFDCLVFSFSWVTLFDHPYGVEACVVFIWHHCAKGVRDVDPTCRCHQSNIMPDSIFSVNIAQCVTCS